MGRLPELLQGVRGVFLYKNMGPFLVLYVGGGLCLTNAQNGGRGDEFKMSGMSLSLPLLRKVIHACTRVQTRTDKKVLLISLSLAIRLQALSVSTSKPKLTSSFKMAIYSSPVKLRGFCKCWQKRRALNNEWSWRLPAFATS